MPSNAGPEDGFSQEYLQQLSDLSHHNLNLRERKQISQELEQAKLRLQSKYEVPKLKFKRQLHDLLQNAELNEGIVESCLIEEYMAFLGGEISGDGSADFIRNKQHS